MDLQNLRLLSDVFYIRHFLSDPMRCRFDN